MTIFKPAILAALLALPSFANAGSSAAQNPILPVAQVTSFADTVQTYLADKGARVAIVSRMGRDPAVLPDGITYTHVAFWVFSKITLADGSTGQGYRVYNLYQLSDDPSRSALVQDSPADFFAGAVHLDAGIIVPKPALQQKLMRVINGPTYASLHNARYSVLANPRTTQFQNCTEHTVDVLMAALYDTHDPARIKANIAAHFTPQPIRVGGVKRALAVMASPAMTTADHGAQVDTATFGAIRRFMDQYGLTQHARRITP